MSLCSLKKSTPSAKPAAVSVDDFIAGADLYAHGGQLAAANQSEPPGPMRRATFTLTESTIERLSVLSEQSGMARSRLVRLWVDRAFQCKDFW